MYILIVTNGFPSDQNRGLGIFEFDQSKALAKIGCKVIIAAIDVRSIRRWRKWGIECHNKDGVQVYIINIPGGRLPLRWMTKLSSWGLNILYDRIVREHDKPDIVHAHFTEMGYVAAKLIKKNEGLPLVITEHSSLINQQIIPTDLFQIANEAYGSADAIIAVSPSLTQKIKTVFDCAVICIPNIVDTTLFYFSPRAVGEEYNFVATGSLVFSKRMDLTIEAFAKAFPNNDNVKLTIFGDGIEKSRLNRQIKHCK